MDPPYSDRNKVDLQQGLVPGIFQVANMESYEEKKAYMHGIVWASDGELYFGFPWRVNGDPVGLP